MNRTFDNGRIKGQVSYSGKGANLGLNAGQAKISFDIEEEYWGTVFFLIPWKKRRKVTRTVIGSKKNWRYARNNQPVDFDEFDDDFIEDFLFMAWEECHNEYEVEHFDEAVHEDVVVEDESFIENVVEAGTEEWDRHEAQSADIVEDTYVEPEATSFEPVTEEPVYVAPVREEPVYVAPEPEPVRETYSAPEPSPSYSSPEPSYSSSSSYDSGGGGGCGSDD